MALTTAALSLPGMIPKIAQAESSMPEKFTASYRFTEYSEDDQAANTTSTGESVERFDISIHQFSLVAPVSSNVSVNLDASTETLSGASPWYVAEGADGKPVQVMSGATIYEKRDDVSLSANYFHEKARFGLGIARSSENDYDSTSASVNTSVWFNDKNTTVDAGLSFSDDSVSPTQDLSIDPGRVVDEEKDSQSFSIGVAQIVNKTLLVGVGFNYANYDGFLSDPYKLASVEGVAIRDSRPDSKEQYALDFKLRQYVTKYNGAIHADYKFFDNSWGVSSHTVGLGWYQNINTWQLSTSLRWYDQSSADFHRNFFTEERADGYYSSDYRLSAYSALSYKLGLSKTYDFGTLRLSYENYNSGEGTQTDGDLSPGLVDFQSVTVGFDYKF